jgi:predicted lipoprotein with Yx(FWY)xxD motif
MQAIAHPRLWITTLAVAGLTAACSSSAGAGGGGGSAPPTSSTSAAAASTAAISVRGGHLVGPGGKTLYFNTVDSASAIKCTSACANLWPPVVGHPSVSGGLSAKSFATATRPDGSVQVTFRGHPLYEFGADSAGTTMGSGIQDFGGRWVVATATGGAAVSTPAPASSGGGGGGYGYP